MKQTADRQKARPSAARPTAADDADDGRAGRAAGAGVLWWSTGEGAAVKGAAAAAVAVLDAGVVVVVGDGCVGGRAAWSDHWPSRIYRAVLMYPVTEAPGSRI